MPSTNDQPRRDGFQGGVCCWLTGLSGAGKSTTANALANLLRDRGVEVCIIDGDQVRANISKDLGFSKADRHENVMRVAALARRGVEDGKVVICALVSPYRGTRGKAKRLIGPDRFVEVFVDTPLAVCEKRDPKGLYSRFRRGELIGLTGLDDPYEAPLSPDLTLSTCGRTVEENVREVLNFLVGGQGLV